MDAYYTHFSFRELYNVNGRVVGLATFTEPRSHFPKTAIVKVIPPCPQSVQEVVRSVTYRHFRNIVQVYAYYRTALKVVIFMEHCEMGSLDKLFETLARENRVLPEAKLLSMMQDVAEALAHLHAHKTVHRDIKPHNVFVTVDYRCKLGDLETLKVVDERCDNILQSRFAGTVEYMAPEKRQMYEMSPHQPPMNSEAFKEDVWALGKTFYEMCCGAVHVNSEAFAAIYFNPSPFSGSFVFKSLRERKYSQELAKFVYSILAGSITDSDEVVRQIKSLQNAPPAQPPVGKPAQLKCEQCFPGRVSAATPLKLPNCMHVLCTVCLLRYLARLQNSSSVRFLEDIGCPTCLRPIPLEFIFSLAGLSGELRAHVEMLQKLSDERKCPCGKHNYIVVRHNGSPEPFLYRCESTRKKFCSWCQKPKGHRNLLRQIKDCNEFPFYAWTRRNGGSN